MENEKDIELLERARKSGVIGASIGRLWPKTGVEMSSLSLFKLIEKFKENLTKPKRPLGFVRKTVKLQHAVRRRLI